MSAPFLPRSLDTEPQGCETLRRWWIDPAFRAEMEAERAREQAKINARFTESVNRYHEKRARHALNTHDDGEQPCI